MESTTTAAVPRWVSQLGLRTGRPGALVDRIEDGLSWAAFERLRGHLDLPQAELARLVRIAPSTLARRRAAGRLRADESDRLVRLSRLFADAVDLFDGDVAEARAWAATPREALGGRSPLDSSSTDVGSREVEALIDRLRHGVFQ